MVFTNWSGVMAHLDALGLFHMDMRLDRMARAVARLGLDREQTIPTVQIVGTNGKGSTAAFIDALARAHGLRTGLYTSPHLARINERIRINGHPLPDAAWPELATAVYAAAPDLTHFEFLTALAMLAFVRAGVDCIILEAGLGGRYDATTALPADVVAFTPIALDHTAVLGPDVHSIASDKAHAMRPGRPAMTGAQLPDAMDSLRAMATERGCPLLVAPPAPSTPSCAPSHTASRMLAYTPSCVYGHVPCGKGESVAQDAGAALQLGLHGPHQMGNAALALCVWRTLVDAHGWHSTPEAERAGLAAAFIPGRLQYIAACAAHPPLLLDGAHNPHGLEHLEQALHSAAICPRAVIFTCLADKDAAGLLPGVVRIAGGGPVFVPGMPDNLRARPAQELAAQLQAAGADARPMADIDVALAAAFQLSAAPTTHSASSGNSGNSGNSVHSAHSASPDSSLPRSHSDASRSASPVLLCGSLYLLGDFFMRFPAYLDPPSTAHAARP